MNFFQFDVVMQEVPGEISLSFSITGCPLRCKGCHSSFLWKSDGGYELTTTCYNRYLKQYREFASCVLFMGGEWEEDSLISYLRMAHEHGYRTCLYTGLEEVSSRLRGELDYLKTGPWIPEKGGLDNPSTNQRFLRLSDNKELNHLFQYL